MITVKLFGGLKKSFSTGKLEIKKEFATITELLDFLQKSISNNTLPFDIKNILIAINGVDSSTLQGFATNINNGDVISIIPIIHGGYIEN